MRLLTGATLLVVGSCAASATSPGTSDAPAPPATTIATTASSSTTTTVPSRPDPDQLLRRGVEALRDGYEFTATVTVGEEPAATTIGRWYEGSAILTVTSGAASVDYLITPAGQWARTTSGEWSQVKGEAPVADPLSPIGEPSSTTLDSWDGSTAVITAVYPAERFGGSGDPVEVTITVRDGVVAELSYRFESEGVPVEVTTTFRPSEDTTPITAP